VAVLLAAVGVVALVIELVPSKNGVAQHFTPGRVQQVTTQRQVPLTRVDRRQIDAVLDRFVTSAILRHHPIGAWAVSTKGLRAGTTRRQWARGDVPVFPYPARGRHFRNWFTQFSFRKHVGIELGLSPRRGAKVGAAAYELELRRVRGAWRVDSVYLRAIYPR